jgi:hypothetical protein
LLAEISALFHKIADFSKIVTTGWFFTDYAINYNIRRIDISKNPC